MGGYVVIDSLGNWTILCAAVVYFLASVYAIGYMRMLGEDDRLHRFYAMFAGFALSTLVGPMMNNAGLYWIAIELTTLISTFLVAFEREATSIEAAWKYIIVVSAGISLALLGTVLFYWSGTFVLGQTYDMTWQALEQMAPRLNRPLVSLSFLLVLIGYGTKVGLAPMHTWLPDAHSEGPAPVSALLSGALLNTAMVGIVRYLVVADAAGITSLAHGALLGLGAFSLFVAALFIVRQTGIKRLMAYSSVEHMGVIALGFGFGGPLGIAGALYHMLNHSLNKSAMFFGAGSVMRAYGTKQIHGIHGVLRNFPVLGGLWLAFAVAITGAPPFALFLSELTIIRGGLADSQHFLVGLMAILLIVIFVGFLNHFKSMYFDDGEVEPRDGSRQRMVHCSHVVGAGAAAGDGAVVAASTLGAFSDDSAHAPPGYACGGGAMIGARIEQLEPGQLHEKAETLRHAGARVQFAYAWSPEGDDREVRYVWAIPDQTDFEVWAVAARELPSLAPVWPLLGWYEREMMDLQGVKFVGHPEPYPLILRDGDSTHINGRNSKSLLPTNGRPHLPAIEARDVQQLPFGPVRADVLESAEFTFFYVGEHIIHYQPRLFFKHRGMEMRFEGARPDDAVIIAERVSAVGTVCHALAFCEAVERAAGCEIPARAKALRVLLAELERLYNHLHYLGHLCNTTTLKVGEAQGKLLEEKAKQLNGRLTGSRFLRGVLTPGGLRRDLSPDDWLGEALESLRTEFIPYVERLELSESHLDRLITTGLLPRQVAFDQGATGPIERASGLNRDLRRDHPYAHYAELPLTVATFEEGDAYARERVRIAEVEAAFVLCQRILLLLEPGEIRTGCVPAPLSQGLGWTEGPRGSVFYAVHVAPDGRLARVKIKSPSFSNWRAFPFTVHDTNMMDYAINEASFGLTMAGCDR